MDWVLIVVIFAVNVGLWWKLRSDDTFLKEYVRSSPKAYLWRKWFGEERAAEIIRDRLVPFGMALWVVLLVFLGVAELLGVG